MSETKLNRRLGRFFISRELLLTQPERLQPLFAEMIVVEAQMRWDCNSVEYVAMSDRFEDLPENLMAPAYDILFKRDEDGKVTFTGVDRSISLFSR